MIDKLYDSRESRYWTSEQIHAKMKPSKHPRQKTNIKGAYLSWPKK
jgi:hypothetical protein